MRCIQNIAYGPAGEHLLDLYLPDAPSFDLFLYFHGGGLEAGHKAGDPAVYETLAAHGVAVASADYRMYPDAKYPDFVEDAARCAAFVHAHIGAYGQCRRIFIGGSSAGGYLSMMLCFDPRWLGAYGLTACDFTGFVHDAGQPTKHFNVLREMGEDTRRIVVDETAPLYHVCANACYPPMLFIVSDDDIKGRYEQTMLMLATLEHMGHDRARFELAVMHGGHCAYVNRRDEQGEGELGKLVLRFIDSI